MRVVVVGPTYPEAFAENISAALARAGASVTHVDSRSLVATVLARDGVVPRAVGAFERIALEQARLRRQLLGRPFADRVAAGMPDLVISTDGTLRRGDLVEARSRLGRGVPWVLWYPDHMANLGAQDALAAGYDRLYFKDALLVRRLAAMTGLPVRFLPEACDPFRHRPVDPTGDEASRYAADLALAGNMYAYRAEILKLLPAALDLRLYGKRARNATVRDAWFTGEFVADRAKSLAFGCAVAVLNTMHYAEIESVNARLFEATGCGALVLSDWRPGIDKLFVDGDEILTFRTVDELLSRWRSIEEMSEQERQTMRARAVARAHADHAYPDRLAVVFDDLGFSQLDWVRHPDGATCC